MNNKVNSLWQNKPEAKIKHRGTVALASFAVSNNTKISCSGNKYIWPNSFPINNLNNVSEKKTWKSL